VQKRKARTKKKRMGCKQSVEKGGILEMRKGEGGKTEKTMKRELKEVEKEERKWSEVAWMWEELA